MSERRHPQAVYQPREGELVHDAKHNLTGVYQCPGFGKYPTVYLRPVGGGIEWETPTSEIQQITSAGELESVKAAVPRGRPSGGVEL
ncbi:hypothetical protein OG455_17335 [Kitasatospora sp. NBC_01287]|uniref:hypothetical protein n=1 Tax=Kitasatospora sp. NBC_01287 TaxID=2903573 RepID=UPI0022569371|nr:hypothetical protein [Kitasatospora sp. NBC_01287]MCX4747262.1 hypothetical protein [Kitasatospora sp. NBC_01287]